LRSAVSGVGALLLVDVLGSFTGVSMALNSFTLAVCGAFGVPGTVTLLVLKAVFG
jgi:hypothetical protein